MADSLRRRDYFVHGMLIPLVIMVAGLLVIMNLPTGASAAEFSSLGIMLVSIAVAPFVLIINAILAFQPADSTKACLKRGMITPGIVLIGAFVYQIGLWDAFF